MFFCNLFLQQTGRVSQREFTAVATSFLLHNTPANALQEVSGDIAAVLSQSPTEELAQLQSFLRRAVSRSQAPRSTQPATTSFAPHIYQHSYKLASKREKKEREQIEQQNWRRPPLLPSLLLGRWAAVPSGRKDLRATSRHPHPHPRQLWM